MVGRTENSAIQTDTIGANERGTGPYPLSFPDIKSFCPHLSPIGLAKGLGGFKCLEHSPDYTTEHIEPKAFSNTLSVPESYSAMSSGLSALI